MSVAMAELAAGDGIRCIACTPHVRPGIHDNSAATITDAVRRLRAELERREIGIEICCGADVHVSPDLPERIGSGGIPTIARSRYFLFEPSHHVLTPRLEELASRLIERGIVPIITHPERLSWLSRHYETFIRMNESGCLVQVTAGSITGQFGRSAKYYSDKLLDEGRIDIIASDAHDCHRRPPVLSRARDCIAARAGDDEAMAMVFWRPLAIVADRPLSPAGSLAPAARRSRPEPAAFAEGFLQRILRGMHP
jgi:protein-tyrosine phosphatase